MGPSLKSAQLLKIALGATALSVVYGICHDLITAQVCLEYFTLYHPHLVDSQSPVVMALLWGVIATWWFGLIGGIATGVVATRGAGPPIPARRALLMIAKMMVVCFALAMLALLVSPLFATSVPDDFLPSSVAERHIKSAFLSDLAAHNVSYFSNFVGAVIVCIRIHLLRRTA